MDNKTMGLKIKAARNERGWSQDELADKLGLTWEMISRYENGRSSAIKHLPKLMEVFAKPAGYFLGQDQVEISSLSVEKLAMELRQQGINYNSSSKQVVKIVESLSGKGIDLDLAASDEYYETKASWINEYTDLFALDLEKIELAEELVNFGIIKSQTGLFTQLGDHTNSKINLGYNGEYYRLQAKNQNSEFFPIATLVATEAKYT